MSYFLRTLTVLLACLLSHQAFAVWSISAGGGGVYNFETHLKIKQDGFNNIHVNDADYETRPLTDPPYYSIKLGHWEGNKAWEIEHVHHKIYLKNKPPEVKRFSISHGYNLITVNRALQTENVIWRGGFGFVLSHPENTVRGLSFDSEGGLFGNGYFISGPTAQATVEKRFYFSQEKKLFVSIEGKVTASFANVHVRRGNALVPNAALHAVVSIGLDHKIGSGKYS